MSILHVKAIKPTRERPGPCVAACLDFIGSALDVLYIGAGRADLFAALEARGCRIAHVSAPTVRALVDSHCDAVVLDEVVCRPGAGSDLLEYLRGPLSAHGRLVWMVRNSRHGDIRLAIIKGASGPTGELLADFIAGGSFHWSKELLTQAGYRLDEIKRVCCPVFPSPDILQEGRHSDFSAITLKDLATDQSATA